MTRETRYTRAYSESSSAGRLSLEAQRGTTVVGEMGTGCVRPAVFGDELAASHFLRVARKEMGRAGVEVPLWVSYKRLLG